LIFQTNSAQALVQVMYISLLHRSYLKLYTSMPVQKLARFLEMKEEVLLQHLYTYKVSGKLTV
jgi:hypothetical protein